MFCFGCYCIISKLTKVAKIAKVASTKVGKVATDAVANATSSVVGSVIQGNEVTAEGVVIDVAASFLGNKISDNVYRKAQSSTKGKMFQKKARKVKKQNSANTGCKTKVSKRRRMQKNYDAAKTKADKVGKGRAAITGAVGSNTISKTVGKIKEKNK